MRRAAVSLTERPEVGTSTGNPAETLMDTAVGVMMTFSRVMETKHVTLMGRKARAAVTQSEREDDEKRRTLSFSVRRAQ